MAPHEIRSFGPFVLDPVNRTLHRGKFQIRLQPRPMRLLLLLTERPGELITRKQAQNALWGEQLHGDFDQGLNFAIRKVREALGDSGAMPTYIKTEPTLGYRFIGEIAKPAEALPLDRTTPIPAHVLDTGDSVISDSSPRHTVIPPVTSSRARPLFRWHWLRGAVTLSSACLLLLLPRHQKLAIKSQEAGAITLLVLPATNQTGSAQKDQVLNALTDTLQTDLSNLGQGRVRLQSGGSGALPSQQHLAPGEIGRRLNVAFVLSSSLALMSGQRNLAWTLQLTRVRDGKQVWSRWRGGDEQQILSAANELAADCLQAVGLPLQEAAGSPGRPRHKSPATLAYERGKQALWNRTQTGMNAALDDFKEAIAADPRSAPAFAELAITYEMLGSYGFIDQKEAVAKANIALADARRLGEDRPEVLAALGYLQWFYEWNWKDGEDSLRRAIEQNETDADALAWYGLALTTEGGHELEARQQIERAIQLEPMSKTFQTNLGWQRYLEGHPEQASGQIEAVLREDPYFLSARLKLWAVYSVQNRYDDAFRQLNFVSLDMLSPDEREHLSHTFEAQGYVPALSEWSRKNSQGYQRNTLFRAELAAFTGNRERTVRILTDAYLAHDGWMVFALVDPALHEAWKDPRLRPVRSALSRGQHWDALTRVLDPD